MRNDPGRGVRMILNLELIGVNFVLAMVAVSGTFGYTYGNDRPTMQ